MPLECKDALVSLMSAAVVDGLPPGFWWSSSRHVLGDDTIQRCVKTNGARIIELFTNF